MTFSPASGQGNRRSTGSLTGGHDGHETQPEESEHCQNSKLTAADIRVETVRVAWQAAFDRLGPMGTLDDLADSNPALAESLDVRRGQADYFGTAFEAGQVSLGTFEAALKRWELAARATLTRVPATGSPTEASP